MNHVPIICFVMLEFSPLGHIGEHRIKETINQNLYFFLITSVVANLNRVHLESTRTQYLGSPVKGVF